MTNASKSQSRAFLAMLLGGIMIAFSPIFMRYATDLSDVSPSAAAFWRVSLSLPLLMLVIVWQRKSLSMLRFDYFLRREFWLVGFFFAADLAFWHWSVDHTTVANATLLANMAAIFTACIGFLFFKERFSRLFLLGLCLSVIGAAALMGHSFTASPENLYGDILGIVTALAYAGYIVAANKARKRYSTVQLMFWGGMISALFLLPITLFETKALMPATLDAWWPLLGLAWISHLLGQSLIIYGLAHLSAAMGSVSLLIQPLVAALLASTLFSELLVIYHLVGGVLILAGIMICKQNDRS